MSVSLHELDTDVRFTWAADDPNEQTVRAAELFERASARGQSMAIRRADGSYTHLGRGAAFPTLAEHEEVVILPQVAGG